MQDAGHNPVRIVTGKYQVDVLRDGTAEHFWYYIIRRKDSKEIINLVKFDSYEKAIAAARKALSRMHEAAAS